MCRASDLSRFNPGWCGSREVLHTRCEARPRLLKMHHVFYIIFYLIDALEWRRRGACCCCPKRQPGPPQPLLMGTIQPGHILT